MQASIRSYVSSFHGKNRHAVRDDNDLRVFAHHFKRHLERLVYIRRGDHVGLANQFMIQERRHQNDLMVLEASLSAVYGQSQ